MFILHQCFVLFSGNYLPHIGLMLAPDKEGDGVDDDDRQLDELRRH